MKKRFCTALLLLALLSALTVPALATDYFLNYWSASEEDDALTVRNADGILAISTSIATDGYVEGSFQITAPKANTAAPYAAARPASVSDEPYLLPCPVRLDPKPVLTAAQTAPNVQRSNAKAADYHVGSEFYLTSDPNTLKLTMQCLYIGAHCTVWGAKTDEQLMPSISAENAQQIANAFDSKFDQTIALFANDHRYQDMGSYWTDVDGDGKIAIMCYDLDSNYKPSEIYTGGYLGGYFYSGDLAQDNGKGVPSIEGVLFNGSITNGVDCLHLDTYPLMGSSALYSEVENSFSTLTHEFQHMLNFSSGLWNLKQGSVASANMPTYLNEAFSMAAEHLLWGSETTAGRVQYMRNSYEDGTSLTFWGNNPEDELSQYSLSFLLGQYFRARYAQLTDTNGNDVYKKILTSRAYEVSDGSTLGVVAEEVLDAGTALDLLSDFWVTLRVNESSGLFSFGGEPWLTANEPLLPQNTPESGIHTIRNGSAKYYALDPTQEYAIDSIQNVFFVTFSAIDYSCGENLTWSLDDDGTLHITGTGNTITHAPWNAVPSSITAVSIPAAVTAITENSFGDCENLSRANYGGSIETWSKLSIAAGNTPLQTAQIQFAAGPVQSMQRTDGVITLTRSGSSNTLLVAFYHPTTGRFLRYGYMDTSTASASISTAAANTFRLFSLDATQKPLTPAITLPLT